MPAGRPTKYNKQILVDTQDYLDNHYEKHFDIVPSIAGLAYSLNISKPTVYDWSNQDGKEEFSYMLAQILTKQEKMLLNGGLATEDHPDLARMNPTIVKLMLAKHNYSEKTEATVTINPLTEVIAQISGATIGPKTSD